MGAISYTAQRSLVTGHIVGEVYLLLIDFTDDTQRSAQTEKVANRSLSGVMEVIRYYESKNWNVITRPVNGVQLEQMRECMSSTDGGEVFQIDIYGSSAFRQVRRTDTGYNETPFSRVGEDAKDYIQISFSVLEV